MSWSLDQLRLWIKRPVVVHLIYACAVTIALLLMFVVAQADAHPHYPDRYTYDTDLWTPEALEVRTLVELHSLKVQLLPSTADIPRYWTAAPPKETPPERSSAKRLGTGTFSAGVEQWRSLVARFFAPGDVDTALRIIRCESGGNPNAKNPRSSASGLWQHLGKYWESRSARAGIPGADIYDPEASTIVAAWLRYEAGGWGHWTCY